MRDWDNKDSMPCLRASPLRGLHKWRICDPINPEEHLSLLPEGARPADHPEFNAIVLTPWPMLPHGVLAFTGA